MIAAEGGWERGSPNAMVMKGPLLKSSAKSASQDAQAALLLGGFTGLEASESSACMWSSISADAPTNRRRVPWPLMPMGADKLRRAGSGAGSGRVRQRTATGCSGGWE